MERIGKGLLVLGLMWAGLGSMPFIARVPSQKDDRAGILAAASHQSKVISFVDGPIKLGRCSTRVTLAPTSPTRKIEALAPGRRIYLVVRDLRVTEQPGVLYRVYLDLPPDAKPGRTDPHYAGTLNFFNAAEPGATIAKDPMFFSYDITTLLRNLRAHRLLFDQTTVTIIPSGTPALSSEPSVGRIEIVEQ